jgi:predicted Zn-ribbon and HTH transcriptional regulator
MSAEDKDIELYEQLMEMQIKARLAEIRSNNNTSFFRPTECDDCGNEIEPIRWSHGFSRCISCQREQEYYNARN